MPTTYTADATLARHMAMLRGRRDDPRAYSYPPKQKRLDAKFVLSVIENELAGMIEQGSIGNCVRIKCTIAAGILPGDLLTLSTASLTAQTSAVATNSPLPGTSVLFLVAATYEVGQIVKIVSGGFTDYAIVTAIVAGVSVTVDALPYAHTTPTITALPAYEAVKAVTSAAANLPADWVAKEAIALDVYGWAYDMAEVTVQAGQVIGAAEDLLYLKNEVLFPGRSTNAAPVAQDLFQQIVGVVKTGGATQTVLFFPGLKKFIKYGTSYLQDSAVTTAKIAASAVTTDKINDLNVTTPKIADLAVTTAKIDNLAVTTGKIADGAVTNAKLAVGLQGIRVIKSANQSKIDATITDDTELQFAIGANEKWCFEINVFWSMVGAVAGITWDINSAAIIANGLRITHEVAQVGANVALLGIDAALATARTILNAGAGSTGWIRITGEIECGGAGGTFRFRFAQDVLDGANATIILKGSNMVANRVA